VRDAGSERVWTARVGSRVVVRHRLPEGGLTDSVGELVSVGSTVLTVVTRRGTEAIGLDDVVAGKVVPPRPSRPAPPHLALSLGDLERLTARHWAAAETAPLGDWLLRAHGGFTGRANSVLVQGDPGMPVADALDAVRAWYADRGLPALASLAVPADAEQPVAGPPVDPALLAHLAGAARLPHVDGPAQLRLRAELDRLGWAPGGGISAYCLTAPLRALLTGAGAQTDGHLSDGLTVDGLTVDMTDLPDDGWLATYKYRGNDLPAFARELLLSAPEQVFVSVRTSGDGDGTDGGPPATVAVARGSLAGGWGCVTAVDVAPSHRRRGLATVLLRQIARWAADRGAGSMMLQTAAANGPAQRLYLEAGFTVHHRYDYLTPNPTPS
jgi:GNAT superfamily N-acetyltransferase